MLHMLSIVGILFWPLSQLAQNNPDLEYKQYETQRGEQADESAVQHTVQEGDALSPRQERGLENLAS